MPEQVVTELVIDATGAKTGSDAYVAAMTRAQAVQAKTNAGMTAANDIMNKQSQYMITGAQSATRLASNYDRLRASVDPVTRAMLTLEKQNATLDAVAMRGVADQEAVAALRNELMDAQVAKLDEVQAAQLRANLGVETETGLLDNLTAAATRAATAMGLMAANENEAAAAGELMAKGEEIAGEAAKGLLASLGPLLALTALAELPAKIMETSEAVSKIGENAETIGTTAKNLQELDYAATQYSVSADTMNSALERFTKNIGIAETGTGVLAKVLKANGIGITGNTVTDLENYANLIERATTAEQRNFLITTAFGKGSSDLGNLFRDGADGIQEMIDKADSANVVLSNGTIESAHQLNQEFQSLETQLNATFEEFIINIAPTLEATLQGLTNIVRAANAVVDVGKIAWDTAANANLPIEQQSTEYLERDLAVQQKLYAQAQANPHGFEAGAFDQNTAGYQTKATAEQAELDKRGGADIDSFISGNDGLNGGWGTLPPAAKLPPAPPGAKTSAEKQADQFSKMIATTQASTASLVAQQQALGLSAFDADKLTEQTTLLGEAQEKNIKLSPAQLTAIDAASTDYAKQKTLLDALTEVYNDGKQASEDFFSQLKSDLMSGTSLWGSLGDAASKALNDIADKALQMAADGVWNMIFGAATGGASGSSGGGWLSGLLGIFGIGKSASSGLGEAIGSGSSYATGGYTGPGGVNAPAGFVHRGEYVFDAMATSRIGVPALDAMRAMTSGYAMGGYVRGQTPAANYNAPQAANANVSIHLGDTHIDGSGLSEAQLTRVLAKNNQAQIALINSQVVPVVHDALGIKMKPGTRVKNTYFKMAG